MPTAQRIERGRIHPKLALDARPRHRIDSLAIGNQSLASDVTDELGRKDATENACHLRRFRQLDVAEPHAGFGQLCHRAFHAFGNWRIEVVEKVGRTCEMKLRR